MAVKLQRFLLFLLTSFFLFPAGALAFDYPFGLPADNPVSVRSLFIAGDLYITEENTWPSFINSAKLMAAAMEKGNLNYVSPPSSRIYSSTIKSVSGLEKAIRRAFLPSDDNDISYFYISVHGIQTPSKNNAETYLLLSDGTREEKLTPARLEKAFGGIKGTKVLFIDACHSGAFIGKGVEGGAVYAAFTDPSFKVIVSAGASEKSWMHTAQTSTSIYSSLNYFSSAIAQGFGYFGKPEADIDRNGKITLDELHRYLLSSYALSTPYVYPEQDSFVVFSYNPNTFALPSNHPSRPIIDVELATNVLTSNAPTASLSFTATTPTNIAYQLIYYRSGAWQLDQPYILKETDDLDALGNITPGRKTRTLMFDPPESDSAFAYGYAMLQIIAFVDGEPLIQASRLLTVIPENANPRVQIYTPSSYTPENFKELPIFVRHQYPCKLTINILDDQSNIVRRLVDKQPTRPNNMLPQGSSFFWDGANEEGLFLPQGSYKIQVRAHLGKDEFISHSSPFLLFKESEG